MAIQKLQLISNELQDAKTERAHELIKRTAERIETQLLDRFTEEVRLGKLEQMRETAEMLCAFVSRNVIKKYVQGVLSTMPEPDMELKSLHLSPVVCAAKIRSFYGQILSICKDTLRVVDRVFPNPAAVCVLLFKGIFEDKMSVFIDICVKKSTSDIDTLGILENAVRTPPFLVGLWKYSA